MRGYRLKTVIFLVKRKIENKLATYRLYLKKEDNVCLTQLEKKPLISFVGQNDGLKQSYDNYELVSDLKNAKGEYIAFIDQNMVLSENALYFMVKQLEQEEYDLIYCDEDMLVNGKRCNPFFKPDWSPHTLRSFNYIGFSLIKRSAVEVTDSYYDLLLRLSYKDIRVKHVARVLVHYKKRAMEQGTESVKNNNEKISIIIPSKDNLTVLERCINSIRDKSSYNNYEIIVVDNGSCEAVKNKVSTIADRYIYKKMDFNFSKMCNMGAENATGDFFLFLNDDTQVISHDWLEKMLGIALQKQTGAVGCMLLYPQSDKIQHCGVINIKNGPIHPFIGKEPGNLYFGRDKYNYNCCAVTGACLMVDKNKFFGFDEELRVAYNDIDLCFDLVERGYFNVCVPQARLYHYESVSRGNDRTDENKLKRLFSERQRLYDKHKELAFGDRFYNRNLTGCRADFSLENPKYINKNKFCMPLLRPKDYLSDLVKGEIEYISMEDMIGIGGFAYIHNKSTRIRLLLLTADENALCVKVNMELRMDMDNKICGFCVNIPRDMLEKREYSLGVLLTDAFTGKKYVKIFDEKLIL